MQTKKGYLILALLLFMALPFEALAMDSFRFEAKVTPAVEKAAEMPFDGKVDEVYVQTGDRVKQGHKLLTMQTSKLLAKEPGTVESVFAAPGADGKTVEETYHASVILRPEYPMYVVVANKTAAPGKENTTYVRGETLWLKAKTGGHTGVGRIINVKNYTFTVEVLSGDLAVGDMINAYRSETYEEKKRLGNGAVKYFDLTMMNMEGFVVDVLVKIGDKVKAGDPLLTYAPSTELTVYAQEEAIVLKADATGAVVLAPVSDLVLSAKLSAIELSLLEVRPNTKITQEGNPEFAQEGKILWTSSVADENGLYEVRIACPTDVTPRIGAAYQIEVY